MQKIKHSIIDSIINNCTSCEMDFLLYISQFQNELGQVRGLDYKYVCLQLGISHQTFYNNLYSLEIKGLLTVSYENTRLWNVIINDNQFLEYKNYRSGYIKTNFPFLHTQEFRSLRHSHKIVLLKLLKTYRANEQFKISTQKLLEWTRSRHITLDELLDTIRKYFNLTIQKSILIIKLKHYVLKYRDSDLYKRLAHRIKCFCRDFKVGYTTQDIMDIYYIASNRKNKDKIPILYRSITETGLQYKSIQPALVNNLVSATR